MTLSAKARENDLQFALAQLLGVLGDVHWGQLLVSVEDPEFQSVRPTTWDELARRRWVRLHDTNGPDLYGFTALGWRSAMSVTGRTGDPTIFARLQGLMAALSDTVTVTGRREKGAATIPALAQAIGADEDWVQNVLESALLEAVFAGRRATVGVDGHAVSVPRDFGTRHIRFE